MSVPRQIKKAEGKKSKSNVKNVNMSEISCKICNRKFFSYLGFKVHFSKMHADAKAGDYPCKICNESFVSYFRFKIHCSKMHTNIDVSAVKNKRRNGHKDGSLSHDTCVNIPQNEGRADHDKLANERQSNSELKAGKIREYVCTICTKRFSSPLGFKIHSARMHASSNSRVMMKKRKEEQQDGGEFSHNRSAYIPQSRTEFSDSNVPFQSRRKLPKLPKPPMKMSYNSGIYVQPHKLSHNAVHLQPQAKRSHDISRNVQPQAKGSYDNSKNVKLQAKISHASSKHIQPLAKLLDDNSNQVQPRDISEHTERKAFSCNDYDHVDAKTIADDSLKECDSRWSSDSEEMLIAHVSDEGWLWTSVTGNVAET